MSRNLGQLERQVEADYASIAGRLDAPRPADNVASSIRSQMRAEANRLLRRQSLLRALRPFVAIAAAFFVLAVYMPQVRTTDSMEFATADDPNAMHGWMRAADESSRRLTRVRSESWVDDDSEGDWGSPLDALDESFESFESVVGA